MNRKYHKTIIAGNWKMNKTPSQTKEFMTEFKSMMPKGRWCDVAICVPAVCIPAAVGHGRKPRGHRRGKLQRQCLWRLYRRNRGEYVGGCRL